MRQDKKAEIDFFNEPTDRASVWHDFSLESHQKLFGSLSKHCNVLDAGCGTGIFAQKLATMEHSVVGVDISLTSLQIGKKLAHDKGLSIEFIRGDLEYLPFTKESFDLCVCGNILHHFLTIDKVIQEISSCIKHRGRLIALEPNGLNPFARSFNDRRSSWSRIRKRSVTSNERTYSPEELVRVLRTFRFEDFTIESLDNLYPPPFSRNREKLHVRMRSYIFFYLLFPTLDKVLPRIQQGFYIILQCVKSNGRAQYAG